MTGARATEARWTWDGDLASGFDAHAAAHIPLYAVEHDLALELSDWFAPADAVIYDLGCSTGTLTTALADRHAHARVIGVDAEPRMIDAAAQRGRRPNLELAIGDATTMPLQPCTFVVARHLTPFLTAQQSAALVAAAHDALAVGGAMLVLQKTLEPDGRHAAIAAGCLASTKTRRGVDAAAVLAKDRALRSVMHTRTASDVERELLAAGFERVHEVLRWMNWTGHLAVKGER